MTFRYGIEHETAFLRPNGTFADFTNTAFDEFDNILAGLPLYENDYPQLRIGDAGIKHKRWYIEGFERFDEEGLLTGCTPKGIEMRTTIHTTIDGAVAELSRSFALLKQEAVAAQFVPLLASYNPFQPEFLPDPGLNQYEQARRKASPEKQTAYIPMMTQGPDLNMSVDGMSEEQLIDFGRKLTYYSPFIIPFTFSSPFNEGQLWGGLSRRNYVRTGVRPAALVFVNDKRNLIDSVPSLTKPARLAAESGRIEFKACDSCGDFQLYGALLALMKGLLLDTSLSGRRTVPDPQLHQESALRGFDDASILKSSKHMLMAAKQALSDDSDQPKLDMLFSMIEARDNLAVHMIQQFQAGDSILKILARAYNVSTPSVIRGV